MAQVLLGRVDALVHELRRAGEPDPVKLLRTVLILGARDLTETPLLYAAFAPPAVLAVAPQVHALLVGLDFAAHVDLVRLTHRALDLVAVLEPA